jgi:hypothetical protein
MLDNAYLGEGGFTYTKARSAAVFVDFGKNLTSKLG